MRKTPFLTFLFTLIAIIYCSSYQPQALAEDVCPTPEQNPEVIEDSPEDEHPNNPTIWPTFSEAIPNPIGNDAEEEWIELYNPYETALDLNGLSLDDIEGGSKPYPLTQELAPHSYLAISVQDSKISLNNSSDSIRLLKGDEILWEIPYEDSNEGESYIALDGDYEWTDTPTKGAPNIPSEITPDIEEEEEDDEVSEYLDGDLSEDIEISEVFPNPEGQDSQNEWIEITNGGAEPVNLGNWTLDDGPEGSKPYIFPDDTMIEPGETLIIFRSLSKIALNNSNESVRIIDFTGELIDEISYEESEEDKSYALIKIEKTKSLSVSLDKMPANTAITWAWTDPSPGLTNPRWLEIMGTISEFDETQIKLFDGISEWSLKRNIIKPSDSLILKIGNEILVQASKAENGEHIIMNMEWLEGQTDIVANKSTWIMPWILCLILASTGIFIHMKGKDKTLHFS